MTDYSEGDFGEAYVTRQAKGLEKNGVTCFGTIIAIEKKFVLFKDNEGYLYLTDRKVFKFTKI